MILLEYCWDLICLSVVLRLLYCVARVFSKCTWVVGRQLSLSSYHLWKCACLRYQMCLTGACEVSLLPLDIYTPISLPWQLTVLAARCHGSCARVRDEWLPLDRDRRLCWVPWSSGNSSTSLWFRKPDDDLAAGAVGLHQLPSLNIIIPTWPIEGGEFMMWRQKL